LFARAQIFGAFLYPLALTLQLPVYIYVMVLEKESRLRQMQLSMGLKLDAYYAVNFAYNMALYTGIAAFFWLVGTAVKLRFFVQARRSRALQGHRGAVRCVHCSVHALRCVARRATKAVSACRAFPFRMRSAWTGQTAWTTLLVLLVGWGLALVATGFLLSAVLNRPVGRTRTHPPAMRRADTVAAHCCAEPRRGAAAAVCRRMCGRLRVSAAARAQRRCLATSSCCSAMVWASSSPTASSATSRGCRSAAERLSVPVSLCLSLLRPARAPCR
jgi:hypothetical protein